MDRFFCPTLADGTTVTLADDEFHHLVHVLRAKPGDQVELFDGAGRSGTAVVERISKREAQLSRAADLKISPPPAIRVVLGVACPKGDRLKWLVEKATELGVDELIPLQCERSVVEPRENRLVKLEQTVLAACKQCRRNRLMRIGEPQKLPPFLASPATHAWIAHPGGDSAASLASIMRDRPGGPVEVRLAVGPEGGFTAEELRDAAERGVRALSLGRNILRVETAALAAAALMLAFDP